VSIPTYHLAVSASICTFHYDVSAFSLKPFQIARIARIKIIKLIFWYALRTVYKAEHFPECISTAHNSISHTASKVSISW